jgi:hypothetical protein
MDKQPKKIDLRDDAVCVMRPDELLLKRREIAFNVAKGKLIDSGGKIETVMQTAEAFGRGLFEDFIKKESEYWTMEKWAKPVVENIFNPLGTAVNFTKLTDKELRSLVFKWPLKEESSEADMASLFTYGFLRGMFLSAFPDGEILMENTMTKESPMIEFTFKVRATNDDKFERERVKKIFNIDAKNLKNKND